MVDLYLVVHVIVIASLAVLVVAMLLKDNQSKLNRDFAFTVGVLCGWVMSNYLGNSLSLPYKWVVVANHAIFVFSYLVALFLLRFSLELSEDRLGKERLTKYWWPLVGFAVVAGSPLVVKSVHLQNKVYAVNFGLAMPLYALMLILLVSASIYVFRRNIRTSHGLLQRRLKVFLTMLSIFGPILILVQFVLPALTGWFGLTNIGIFPLLGIVYALYYAITKHGLFRLRPAIVRSLAYVVTLAVVTGVYALVTSLLSSALSHSDKKIQLVFNSLLILFAILAYQPLKGLLKRLTEAIFMQQSYDSNELFASLNKVLVISHNVTDAANDSVALIATSLKIEFAAIVLGKSSGGQRCYGTGMSSEKQNRASEICRSLPEGTGDITIDQFGKHQQRLADILDKEHITALFHINIKKGSDGQNGYLLIGPKRTGYELTSEDKIVLKSVADELSIAIQNLLHYEEIQQFNVTLQGKVEDATRKLRATNEKLKQLDETKDEFISMASHQLRTPLTSIKGYLSMVLEGDAGKLNSQQTDMLKQSYMSSQRMVNLIADLLNLSRINTGKFVIQNEPTDLRIVVDQEVSLLREAAAAKDIVLTFEMPKTFTVLPLDETKIHQVVMNFVDNAIYYTPSGGTVEVTLAETPSSVEFRVKDSGIGVPRDVQRHLFTKFFRADNARQARPDGTGLGIFMAKKVIAAQGGSIIFESIEGKGSTFGFRLSKKLLEEAESKAAATTVSA